jgi:hypothetical protein
MSRRKPKWVLEDERKGEKKRREMLEEFKKFIGVEE